MKVHKIKTLDFNKIHAILTSQRLTNAEKEKFVRQYSLEIKSVIKTKLTNSEFKEIMNNRPLIKFRPLKNSYTKLGDKKILAQALNIKTAEIDNHIKKITEDIKTGKIGNTPSDNLDSIKTYVYRHGTPEELATLLDYELKTSKNITTTLYKTLKYNSGGVADYFVRPIHRMSNKTLINLYNIVDKNLQNMKQKGSISDIELNKIAEWTIARIYEIQNNSKLKNAIKLKKLV